MLTLLNVYWFVLLKKSYLVNNQINHVSSRIDSEISNVKAILEQFKAETVKYIAGNFKQLV